MARFRIPYTLEYSLSHPHPQGHWFLLATLVLFLLTLPVLILVNLSTLGSELVPSLQAQFQPNDTLLSGWWGTRRLPALLRPNAPLCQPRDLGRGDAFRLSGSLFDYTVMSTWNTTKGTKAFGVQEQERVEYRGESFAGCSVNAARYDYSLSDQTHSVTVGVLCPGSDKKYPIEISMQTTMTFAWELSKDFIGQYYGPGLDLLNLNNTDTSDYRKVVLAALEVISTDALTILHRPHLPVHPLSMRIVFNVAPGTFEIPDTAPASTLTYLNGTQPDSVPAEAFIYINTVFNLVYVAVDAVNLDLGNPTNANMFRNVSRLKEVVLPNRAPIPINASDWAEGSQTFYYGRIPTQYQTWAEALLDGYPVKLGNPTGQPNESRMVTTYLCPTYHIKPMSSLLSSVFVGSATMLLSVWGVWMFFTAVVAKRIMAPRVQCHCPDCEKRLNEEREAEEEKRRKEVEVERIKEVKARKREEGEARRREANMNKPGMLARFMGIFRAKLRSNPEDPEKAESKQVVGRASQSERPTNSLDIKHLSYGGSSTTKERYNL